MHQARWRILRESPVDQAERRVIEYLSIVAFATRGLPGRFIFRQRNAATAVAPSRCRSVSAMHSKKRAKVWPPGPGTGGGAVAPLGARVGGELQPIMTAL